ncbi:alkaline phosphatase D family protein [Pseudozobellia thermophila]|uniref:Alkaline phosphatase D n=1 Tax=Pseudozobellia thermophila TaxID=192903 RepID=A0A1M6J1J0_9FLAO|nr:alkaline phosphatase D family protein [Pseudozobellia thermophila]SHJ40512.1 alkaline phosphatase D [Pseudozobellia thermophila]
MTLRFTFLFGLVAFLLGCKGHSDLRPTAPTPINAIAFNSDFNLAFGSCNKQDEPNHLWDDIIDTRPDVWVWGGDNIYADTDNMKRLRKMYDKQKQVEGYAQLVASTPVIGTWDDHDYGRNDGGTEFAAKKESQREFLDFMGVPEDSPRRQQEGVYATHLFSTPKGRIKVIVLDTRYFRTALTPDTETEKRNRPNTYGEGTVLGEAQWNWFEKELNGSDADFNLIVSSIQVLSGEHGFETWGNFPHEVDRFKALVAGSKAKGVIVLSGDRHISEFSRTKIEGMDYPLVDFTSSGLTHSYDKYSGEPNRYRVGKVVSTKSFGLLQFNFTERKVLMQILGDGRKVLGQLEQGY